jgi:hypothetical protein
MIIVNCNVGFYCCLDERIDFMVLLSLRHRCFGCALDLKQYYLLRFDSVLLNNILFGSFCDSNKKFDDLFNARF